MSYFATASRGTEEVLAGELIESGIAPVRVTRGGVFFGETLEHAYRACLWSRVASRVLAPLCVFDATDGDAFYDGVHGVDWTEYLGPERTLAVVVAGGRSPVGPPHFLALKTKDAIVDRIRSAEGARPSVDKQHPDVRIHLHLRDTRVTVSLDLAGRGLHLRGIERSTAVAPLRENLAAAVLRLAGWNATSAALPLLDPMCGSGTLLIEAAGIALEIAPGLGSGRFGLEGWRGHDSALWRRLREEALERRESAARRPLQIHGADASRDAIALARRVVAQAGLARQISLEHAELRDARPPSTVPGLVVTNPPYGDRLGEEGELGPLYELLGDVLKRRFPGWTAWVLSGNRSLDKRLGLRPAARVVLHNGPIECRLLRVPITAAPVSGTSGPGWRRTDGEAAGFVKRLRTNLRRIRGWARRHDVTCFRLYDADVPTFNVAVDWYDGAARVEEYGRPAGVDPQQADRRLRDALHGVAEVLGLDPADVVLRVRRSPSNRGQHSRHGDRGRFREVRESGLRFLVNLEGELDTGLFLDDRLLRSWIRQRALDRTFLNLFASTCAATVAAAVGGARSSVSVDPSGHALAWGRRNLAVNDLDLPRHETVRAEVLRHVEQLPGSRRWDLILVAPPIGPPSKTMNRGFEIQRDHAALLSCLARRLTPGGVVLFATHRRGFDLDENGMRGVAAREITAEITPEDFSRRPRLRVWLLSPTDRQRTAR